MPHLKFRGETAIFLVGQKFQNFMSDQQSNPSETQPEPGKEVEEQENQETEENSRGRSRGRGRGRGRGRKSNWRDKKKERKNKDKQEKNGDDDNEDKDGDDDNEDKDENVNEKEGGEEQEGEKQYRKDIFEEVEESNQQKTLFYVHPDELWLKGKNKGMFVQNLHDNISRQLKLSGLTAEQFRVSHKYDEIFVAVLKELEEKAIETLKLVFGISNFGRCYHVARDIEVLKKECFTKFSDYYNKNKGQISNFKCNCSRQDKQFKPDSVEICKIIGESVSTGLNLPAKMKDPDISIFIEVRNKFILFYFEKIEGAHGLPVNSSGRAVVLLSGGFDSPVAAWTVMRRGCSVRFVHFHSAPFGDWKGSVSKVRKLVQVLSKWGGPLDFYSVPIGEQQRIIAQDAPARLRVTLYRRLMFRIARKIAAETKCQTLVTGDSLGQVASQTIQSMTTIQSVISPFLVLRPLIGKNKSSIIKRARKIGTHDLSILPAGDCCSHMLPKNPATKPSIEDAEEGEKKLNIEDMVNSAIANMQKININDPWDDDNDNDEGMACPFNVK